MCGRLFSGRPVRIEAVSVGEIDVEPSVIVIVKKGNAAAFCLDNDSFLIDASPDIGNVQASLLCNIDELNRRRWRSRYCSLKLRSSIPCPERSRQPVKQRSAKYEQR